MILLETSSTTAKLIEDVSVLNSVFGVIPVVIGLVFSTNSNPLIRTEVSVSLSLLTKRKTKVASVFAARYPTSKVTVSPSISTPFAVIIPCSSVVFKNVSLSVSMV